jgi:Mor family transcriptional regulator
LEFAIVITNLNIDGLLAEIRADLLGCELLDQRKAERVAEIVLAGMRRRYGGKELYIPAPTTSEYPRDDILRAYAKNEPVRSICKRYGISTSTFYRLLNTA